LVGCLSPPVAGQWVYNQLDAAPNRVNSRAHRTPRPLAQECANRLWLSTTSSLLSHSSSVLFCSRCHIYSMYPVHPLTQPQMLSPSLQVGATHPDDPRCGHPLQAKLGASPPLLPNLTAPQTIVVTPANVIMAASKLPFPRTQTPTTYTPLARRQRLSMGLCHRLSFA
jgi:hypothetical protein